MLITDGHLLVGSVRSQTALCVCGRIVLSIEAPFRTPRTQKSKYVRVQQVCGERQLLQKPKTLFGRTGNCRI